MNKTLMHALFLVIKENIYFYGLRFWKIYGAMDSIYYTLRADGVIDI